MQLHEHRYPISLSWQPTKEDEGNAEAAANACVIFTKNNLLPSVKILTFTRSEARSARLGSARLGSARLGSAWRRCSRARYLREGHSGVLSCCDGSCDRLCQPQWNRTACTVHLLRALWVLVRTGCVHVS